MIAQEREVPKGHCYLRDLRRHRLELWTTAVTGISRSVYQRQESHIQKELWKSAQETPWFFGLFFFFYFSLWPILNCVFWKNTVQPPGWTRAPTEERATIWKQYNYQGAMMWAITRDPTGLENVWLLTIKNGETFLNTLGVQ